MPVGVQILNKLSVGTRQAGVVDSKTVGQEVLQLLGFDRVDLCLQDLSGGGVGLQELREGVVLHGEVAQRAGGLDGLLSRVHEDQDLILTGVFHELLVADLVHGVEALDGLLVGDTDVGLLERHGPVLAAEVKQALVGLHAQEDGDVLVIRQRGREADQTDVLLGGLDLADGARDDGLQHGAAGVVQQVDLVHDDQAHKLRVGPLVASLARDDVPLLGRGDDDLCLVDLCLGQIHVATQLADDHAIALQALRETLHNLLHQGLHRRNIHNLETRQVEGAVLQPELRHDVQDAQHGTVGLATASRGADQHVLLVLAERNGIHLALHRVQLRGTREGLAAPGRKLRDLDEILRVDVGSLEGLDVNLLVALLLHAEGAGGQLALLVGHVMAAAREGQRVQVEHVRGLLLLLLRDPSLASAEGCIIVQGIGIPLAGLSHLQLLDLLSQVPRHIPLAVALLRGAVQLL
mmetsp:Transcript_117329/g.373813  ORF Transcript_117329/g.373813 Transcript_117329/m.373813 type:complete len:463 (+) Transcript_117329:4361-5749(+)